MVWRSYLFIGGKSSAGMAAHLCIEEGRKGRKREGREEMMPNANANENELMGIGEE
jgi:hypothetical protein